MGDHALKKQGIDPASYNEARHAVYTSKRVEFKDQLATSNTEQPAPDFSAD
jgi:hypothetical protein